MMGSIEFKDVPGFPGYRVGSDGSLWSNRRSRYGMNDGWKRLKPYKEKPKSPSSIYYLVTLRHNNVRTVLRLHQVVLLAFVGPKPDGMVIRHLNNDGTDNRLENLAYGTVKQNAEDMVACGNSIKGEKSPAAVLTAEKVKCARESYKPRSRTTGGSALARRFGVSVSTMTEAIRRTTWKHVA